MLVSFNLIVDEQPTGYASSENLLYFFINMSKKKSIEFTSEQFRTLLELVYLGDQFVNSLKIDTVKRYDQLCQHLFSLAKEFELEDISLPEDPQFPTGTFEESMHHEFVDEYDELTFWDELAERLTERMFFERYSVDARSSMNRDERFILLCRIRDEVDNYLRTKGIDEFPVCLK